MKNRLFVCTVALLALLSLAVRIQAQTPATRLDSMKVGFWPDYDQPEVLVLLTGMLPASTVLPAEVTVPIPADARMNAVAVLADAGMVSIDYESTDGAVTFTTPQDEFRIEYYAPYDVNGVTRSYEFSWLSDLDVAEFSAEIQQPANAISLVSDPAAVDKLTGQGDGLVYHVLPSQAVSAGLPYTVSFSYEMGAEGLTAAQNTALPAATAAQGSDALDISAIAPSAGGTNWPLIAAAGLGVLAIAIGGTWFLASRAQASEKSNKPVRTAPQGKQQTSTTAVGQARYCHVCGEKATAGDRFCRNCGTQLK